MQDLDTVKASKKRASLATVCGILSIISAVLAIFSSLYVILQNVILGILFFPAVFGHYMILSVLSVFWLPLLDAIYAIILGGSLVADFIPFLLIAASVFAAVFAIIKGRSTARRRSIPTGIICVFSACSLICPIIFATFYFSGILLKIMGTGLMTYSIIIDTINIFVNYL